MAHRCPGRHALLITALSSLTALLQSCSTAPVMLYVAVSVRDDEPITSESLKILDQGAKRYLQSFNITRQNISAQITLYPQKDILKSIGYRTQSGFGPDLIISNIEQSNELLAAGLTEPIPTTSLSNNISNINPTYLAYLRNHQGQLSGLPLMVAPQLACFNTKQITTPPTTLQALLSMSANGKTIGLPIDFQRLLWSAGALGALPALMQASQHQTVNRQQQQTIETWLSWLADLSDEPGQSFFLQATEMRQQLIHDQLSWISCSSSEIPFLRRSMGTALGVAPMPSGSEAPTPVNALKAISLGRNSTQQQRKAALELMQFSLQRHSQRNINLHTKSFLPANPRATLNAQQSNAMAAMLTSNQQASHSSKLAALLNSSDPRLPAINALLRKLVGGQITAPMATTQLLEILQHQP